MATDVQTKTCQSCQHWNATNSGKGECRRRAPQAVVFNVADEVKFESRFPVTSSDDWCGDFDPS